MSAEKPSSSATKRTRKRSESCDSNEGNGEDDGDEAKQRKTDDAVKPTAKSTADYAAINALLHSSQAQKLYKNKLHSLPQSTNSPQQPLEQLQKQQYQPENSNYYASINKLLYDLSKQRGRVTDED
ncbi:UNVERIFIED_CONTAM: hypothetical protein HDU68_008841 [Siphonaria sp. JEL0065]|nr:hypothetical protein HDU68_008841 [Siphonaria sp. JEL0065]